jgi:hypothetical protein
VHCLIGRAPSQVVALGVGPQRKEGLDDSRGPTPRLDPRLACPAARDARNHRLATPSLPRLTGSLVALPPDGAVGSAVKGLEGDGMVFVPSVGSFLPLLASLGQQVGFASQSVTWLLRSLNSLRTKPWSLRSHSHSLERSRRGSREFLSSVVEWVPLWVRGSGFPL